MCHPVRKLGRHLRRLRVALRSTGRAADDVIAATGVSQSAQLIAADLRSVLDESIIVLQSLSIQAIAVVQVDHVVWHSRLYDCKAHKNSTNSSKIRSTAL
jgi:lambda repressor-like predicted transcriptional regulator